MAKNEQCFVGKSVDIRMWLLDDSTKQKKLMNWLGIVKSSVESDVVNLGKKR